MAAPSLNLAQWLRRQYDANMTALALHCEEKEKDRRELESIETATDEPTSAHFEQLAEDILARATAEQETQRGRLRFILIATVGNSKSATYPFTVPKGGGVYKKIQGQDSLLAQSYRHTEACMQALLSERRSIMVLMERLVQEHTKQLQSKDQTIRDLTTKLDDAQTNRVERDLALMSEEAKQERIDKIAEQFLLVMPAVVNKIAGKKLLPEQMAPEMLAARTLFQSLSDEQKQEILAKLTPAQQVNLASIMQNFNPDTDEEDEATPS